MSIFKKKKTEFLLEEEDLCCRYCEYAKGSQEGEQVFCKKKKKDVAAEGNCLSFAYDLLKRRPATARMPSVADLEFPQI